MPMLASAGWSARSLFVDRADILFEFLQRIHNDPCADNVLFLEGEGGIGKSLLLRQIEGRYCGFLQTPDGQFIQPWVTLSGMNAIDAVKSYSHYATKKVPRARIDFSSADSVGNSRDLFDCLQAIRFHLGIPTPIFQAACLLYLKKQGKLTQESIGRLLPGAKADLAAALLDQANVGGMLAKSLGLLAKDATASADIAAGTIAKSLWSVAADTWGPDLKAWFAKRKFRGSPFEEIAQYQASEILEELPGLLADDLNTYLELSPKPARIVLLFDDYEALIGREHDVSEWERIVRGRWFTDFLSRLSLALGFVVAVTAQTAPKWPAALTTKLVKLDYLGRPDAQSFLEKAGVKSPDAVKSFLAYAEVRPDNFQPFVLALLVDTHRLATSQNAAFDPAAFPQHRAVQDKQREITS